MAEEGTKQPRKCRGISFGVFVFLLVWIVTAAALGVVLSIQNDPSQSLKTAVFCFSIITFPILLIGFIVWFSVAQCTTDEICEARKDELKEVKLQT
jgi:hypothetical membrane protein